MAQVGTTRTLVPGLQAQARPAQGALLSLTDLQGQILKLSHHVAHPQVSNTPEI